MTEQNSQAPNWSNKQKNAQNATSQLKEDGLYVKLRNRFIEEKIQTNFSYFDAFLVSKISTNNTYTPEQEAVWAHFMEEIKTSETPSLVSYTENFKAGALESIREIANVKVLKKNQMLESIVESFARYTIKEPNGNIATIDKLRLISLEEKTLAKLVSDEKEQERFVKNLFGVGTTFAKNPIPDVEEIKAQVPEEQKREIGKEYAYLLSQKTTTLGDIAEFVKCLPKAYQIELMRYYYKPISLKQLPEVSQNDWNMEAFLTRVIKKQFPNITQAQLDEMIADAGLRRNLWEITVSFEDLLAGTSAAQLAEEDLRSFLAAMNVAKKVLREEEESSTFYARHQDFVEKRKKELAYVNWFADFAHKKSVVHVRPKSGKKQTYFLEEVNKEQSGQSGVILKNITGPFGGVQLKGEKEFVSHQNLLSLFQLIHESGGSCRIQSAYDFQQKLDAGAIKDVVDPTEIQNEKQLLDRIDLFDVAGKKMGLKVGVCFTFGNGNTKGICRITEIGPNGIKLTNTQEESFSLVDFYANFVQAEGKRVAKDMEDAAGLLKALQGHSDGKIKNGFGKLEYKNQKLITKEDSGKADPRAVQYFVNKRNGEAVFVEEIRGCQMKCRRGKWTPEKDGNPPRFEPTSRFDWINIENFYAAVSDASLEPEVTLDPKELAQKTNMQDIPWTGNIFQRWMGGTSFNSMVKGSKNVIKAIQAQMAQGTDLNAAKFALSFAKWLPDGMAAQLQATVKAEDKKLREAVLSKIKTPKAAYKILLNKSAPEYQAKAALLYVAKEGSLYPDDDFKNLQGTFAWYERFGGKRKDTLFMNEMHKCATAVNEKGEHDPKPFLEENLLLEHFKALEKEKKTGEDFDKDLRNAIGEGYKKAKEDAEKKVEGEVRLEDKKALMMKEIEKNKPQGWLGAMGKVLEAGGPDIDMYGVGFIIAVSGLGQRLDAASLKDYAGKGKKFPYTPLLFGQTPADIDLFRRVTIKLAATISSDAKKAAEKATTDPTGKAAKSFWDLYGEKMTPKYMCSITDPVVFLEKSDPDYKAYYDKVGKNLPKLKIEDDAIRAWGYNHDSNSMLMFGWDKYLQKFGFKFGPDGNFSNEIMAKIFDESLAQLDDLKATNITPEAKRKIYKHLYISLATAISNALGGTKAFKERDKTVACEKLLEKYGIDLVYDKGMIEYYNDDNRDLDNRIQSGYDYFMGLTNMNRENPPDSSARTVHEVKKKVSDILRELQPNPAP